MYSLSQQENNNVNVLLANIFARIFYKVNFSQRKGNEFLLSIDLLKNDVRADLLKLTTRNLERVYQELTKQENPLLYMERNGERIFLNLIKLTCEDFIIQQYGCCININRQTLRNTLYTKTLLNECEILFQVPFYVLINPNTSLFQKIYSPIYSFASEGLIEALVDNLIIEISNCIVYFSIVTFSFLDTFRQTIYRAKFLPLRNFERVRNNLIWQLRFKTIFQTPFDLYNNCYRIYILRTNGIYYRVVYANRSNQIAVLPPVQLTIISIIEIQDFLISRLNELIYFGSKGIRFTLTSVIGQFIGLVWRGIIDGLKK